MKNTVRTLIPNRTKVFCPNDTNTTYGYMSRKYFVHNDGASRWLRPSTRSQLKNLVLPMPQDCEINWREHRPSIKSRHIFGMIFDSTSKHHTVNMKLLLVVLVCLAVSSALPVEKQKRDILPGDPRYGTNHHHHHENVIEDARTSTGYSRSLPETESQTSVHVPSNSYGPPNYTPGVPLHKEFLEQSSDVTQFSTPLPNFEVSGTAQLPQLSNTYIPVNTETKKIVTTTTVNVPVQHTKTVTVGPPATSYGTPVVHHTKTSVGSGSHVETHKTVKTEVHDQQVVDLPTPSVKVIQQTPVTQAATQFTSEVKNIPAVSTTLTNNVHADTLYTENLPSYQSSFGGFYDVPSYIPSYTPSVYTNFQPSYNAIRSAYSGWTNYPLSTLDHQIHQPIASQFSSIPTSYSYSQTAEFPQTYQLPQTFTHFVQQMQPLHAVHSVSPVKTVQSYTPVESLTHVHSAHPVHTASSVSTATPVQRVQSVEVLPSVQSEQHTVEAVKTGTPLVHSQVQKGPISDFFQNLSQNFPSLPSFPTLPSFPSLPDLPSFPSTPAAPVETAPQVKTYTTEHKDSITIENPSLSSDNLKSAVVQHVTPANDYVQPTDANGGYVY